MYNSRRVCPKADSPLLICSLGQLIRENNKSLDKTFVYCYDGIGNITSVKEYSYTEPETDVPNYGNRYAENANNKQQTTEENNKKKRSARNASFLFVPMSTAWENQKLK